MDARLTEIYRPSDLQELVMIKMILEREGVDYVITNEHLASVLPMFGPVGLSGMRLMVEPGRAAEISTLLREELGLGG
jgi:Putative prokaryotic signal transducing protein